MPTCCDEIKTLHNNKINTWIHQATIDNQHDVRKKPTGYNLSTGIIVCDEDVDIEIITNPQFPTNDIDTCLFSLSHLAGIVDCIQVSFDIYVLMDFIEDHNSLEFSDMIDNKQFLSPAEKILDAAKQIKSFLCSYRDRYQITNEHTEKLNHAIEKVDKLIKDAESANCSPSVNIN